MKGEKECDRSREEVCRDVDLGLTEEKGDLHHLRGTTGKEDADDN